MLVFIAVFGIQAAALLHNLWTMRMNMLKIQRFQDSILLFAFWVSALEFVESFLTDFNARLSSHLASLRNLIAWSFLS